MIMVFLFLFYQIISLIVDKYQNEIEIYPQSILMKWAIDEQ